MNILFSFGNAIDPTRGGCERATWLVSNLFKSLGHNVYYAITEEQTDIKSQNTIIVPRKLSLHEKIELVKLQCREWMIQIIINEAGDTEDIYLFSKEHLGDLAKVITCIHYDITADLRYFYSSYNFSLYGLTWRKKLKKIVQIIRLPYLKWKHTRNRKNRYRYLEENSDRVVLLSQSAVKSFYRFINRPARSKVLCIPNISTYEGYNSSKVYSKDNIILYVGRLHYGKRIDRILKMWKELSGEFSDWKMIFVGEGDDRDRCERLVRRWGLPRVEFVGHTNDVSYYYSKARILALTSNYEGTPMVIFEAQAYGVIPVVYNSFDGASSCIDDGVNGYLISPFKSRCFVDCLRMLMSEEYKPLCDTKNVFALSNMKSRNQWINLANSLYA